jgi:hypothetical protein
MGGYGKSISLVVIGLKTMKGTKQLKLDPTIYDALIKEKVINAWTDGCFSGSFLHVLLESLCLCAVS